MSRQNRGYSMRCVLNLRCRAAGCVRVLHRILHRFFEVLFCDLQVVLVGNRF